MIRKVVVTGATSFIGAEVVKGLIESGCEVYSIVRPNSKNIDNLPEHENNIVVLENLDSILNVAKIIKEADAFIHLGWDGIGSEGRSDRSIQDRNIENSMNSLRLAKILGCSTFIFAGSQAEYGIQRNLIKEDNSCNPVSEYGKAKLKFGKMAKEFCDNNLIKYIHLRIFSIYGSNDHPWSLVSSCIRSFEDGEHMKLGECTQLWNYMYISDLVEVFTKLIMTKLQIKENDYIYNIASDDTRSLKKYVEELYGCTKQKGTFEYGVRPQNAEGPAPLSPDITRIKGLLDWKPQIGFKEGINKILEKRRINQNA